MKNIVLVIVMTLMASIASIFLKKASPSIESGIGKLITNFNLYIGGFLYIASALINIYILHYMDYSIALPMGAITYIWTLLFSSIILKEKITKNKIIGIICICLGVVMINFK